ncbi:hypothetical protein V8F20_009266 [Naviculisporaceae sp. PSN 640]
MAEQPETWMEKPPFEFHPRILRWRPAELSAEARTNISFVATDEATDKATDGDSLHSAFKKLQALAGTRKATEAYYDGSGDGSGHKEIPAWFRIKYHIAGGLGPSVVVVFGQAGLEEAMSEENVRRNNRGAIHFFMLDSRQLWFRDGRQIWDHKNIFTHRTLTNLTIQNTSKHAAFKRIKKLEWDNIKQLKQSTNLLRLFLDGLHLAAISDALQIPRGLETLCIKYKEP